MHQALSDLEGGSRLVCREFGFICFLFFPDFIAEVATSGYCTERFGLSWDAFKTESGLFTFNDAREFSAR